jgi:hypothetical protein
MQSVIEKQLDATYREATGKTFIPSLRIPPVRPITGDFNSIISTRFNLRVKQLLRGNAKAFRVKIFTKCILTKDRNEFRQGEI